MVREGEILIVCSSVKDMEGVDVRESSRVSDRVFVSDNSFEKDVENEAVMVSVYERVNVIVFVVVNDMVRWCDSPVCVSDGENVTDSVVVIVADFEPDSSDVRVSV